MKYMILLKSFDIMQKWNSYKKQAEINGFLTDKILWCNFVMPISFCFLQCTYLIRYSSYVVNITVIILVFLEA